MATTEELQAPARPVRFEDLGLGPTVLEAAADLSYENPTPVQEQAIPAVLAGRDVLAAAQTGTGKTAAFLLPAMDRLGHVPTVGARGRADAQGPLMLVVTPTRELAQQIEEVCRGIAARTGHVSVTVVGGVGYNPQKAALKRGCDILIATPGRLLDLIDQEACSLSQVSVLVLDEADRMLDMGFAPDVRKIVGNIPGPRQTLLFSATLDEKAVGGIVDLVHDPVRIEIAPPKRPTETVAQYVLPVSIDAKNGLLVEVIKRQGARRVIVFCRTKRRADTCAKRLARAGLTCQVIHGDRSQAQRERALAAFRAGECDVLVATDVLSRGIDISDVSYVVNFDVPSDPVDYIHRIGRTGRAGELGWSLTFVTPDDVAEFYDIEALMGKTVECFDARGLDVGEGAPYLDPFRVPAAQVPGKKARKRRRANARSGAAGTKNAAKVQSAKARRAAAGSKAGASGGAGGGDATGHVVARSGREAAGSRADAGSAGARGPKGASSAASVVRAAHAAPVEPEADFELLSEHEARAEARAVSAVAGARARGAQKGSRGAGGGTQRTGARSSDADRAGSGTGKGAEQRDGAGASSSHAGQTKGKAGGTGAKQRGGKAQPQGAKQRGGRAEGSAKQRGGKAGAGASGKGGSNKGQSTKNKGQGQTQSKGRSHSQSTSSTSGAAGSARGKRDAWRNYDEPSGRSARGGSGRTAGASTGRSSRSTRRPGDGGGR